MSNNLKPQCFVVRLFATYVRLLLQHASPSTNGAIEKGVLEKLRQYNADLLNEFLGYHHMVISAPKRPTQ